MSTRHFSSMITDTVLKGVSVGAICVALGLTVLYSYVGRIEDPLEKE